VEQASPPVRFGLLVRKSLGGGGWPNCRGKRASGGTPAATGQRPLPPPKNPSESKWLQVAPSGSTHFETFYFMEKRACL